MVKKPLFYSGKEFTQKMFNRFISQGFCEQTAFDATKESVVFQSQHQHNNFVDRLNQAIWNKGAFAELEDLKQRLISEHLQECVPLGLDDVCVQSFNRLLVMPSARKDYTL